MKKPNLIYILADDLGYGDVSCFNENSAFETPNFDALAQEGMRFTDAHATAAICTPSRYGILTGRYNWRSRLKRGVTFGYDYSIIEKGRKTIADVLRDCGYNTACVGKWHLGWSWSFRNIFSKKINYSMPIKNGPLDFGFDSFFGIAGSLDMPPYVFVNDNMPTATPDRITQGKGKFSYWRKGPMAPDFVHEEVLPTLTKKVLDKIDEFSQSENPFFIYFPLNAPHIPLLPSEEFIGKSGTNLYGDYVLMCDDVVGQVMKKLKEKGIEDNTIVVFTSDNGCSPDVDYEELKRHGHNPSYVFRGTKFDIYEGGHRIPLIVRWPEVIEKDTICGESVCLCDIMRTMAEINGYTLPDNAGEDSVSNLPLWKGENKPVREAVVHHSSIGCFAITKGEWKLVMWPGSGGVSKPTFTLKGPRVQLFHLKDDISEECNVQGEHKEIVRELKALLEKYIKDGRSTPGAKQKNAVENFLPQLYVSLKR